MKTKLTTLEKRALAYCETLKRNGGGTVSVVWSKSATWGMCPRVENYNGEKVAHASGCGYCKHSAVLAESLCWLGETEEEQHSIGRKSSAGVSSVRHALAAIGWELESIGRWKTYDVHTLKRLG